MSNWAIILFSIIPLVILPVVIFYANKKRNAALRKLSTCLSGSVPKFSFWPIFNGEYQGLRFSISLIPGGKNSPPYLKITLIKNSLFKLRIYRETIFSELGKKIGLLREVKTNDELFDREFLIFSNNQNQTINYLSNASVKNAVRELFNIGFKSLLIDRKRVIIQKPNYILESDLEPSRVTDILQKLGLLATGL